MKNGDNEEELILVTTNLCLRMYQFSHESVSIYKNSHESSYKEVSLLSNTQLRSSMLRYRIVSFQVLLSLP